MSSKSPKKIKPVAPIKEDNEKFEFRVESNAFFDDLMSGPNFSEALKPKIKTSSQKNIQNAKKEQKSEQKTTDKKLTDQTTSDKKITDQTTSDNELALPDQRVQVKKEKNFDYDSWANLGLMKPLIKAVDDLDFDFPTKIQSICVPLVFSGKDVLGSSVTGSGKTAAYLLPIIQQLFKQKSSVPSTKAIVVLPTRELAIQCFEMFKCLNKYTKLSAAVVIGKVDLRSQEIDLQRGPDIVFATPGRLIDIAMNSKGIYFDEISFLVFDEADKLLDMGFKAEIEEIVKLIVSEHRQTLLFSATLEKGVEKLVKLALKNPLRVEANPEFSLSNTLQQEIVKLKSYSSQSIREAVLIYLLKKLKYKKAIVFLKIKSMCHRLYLICKILKIDVVELNGNLSQSERNAAVEYFIANDCVMLATDLAARGLDFQNVDYVINLEMPSELTKYIHRIGRTARAGSLGSCITLVSDEEMINFKKVIRKTNEKVVSRNVDFSIVQSLETRIERLEKRVRNMMYQERVDKELEKAEMEVKKANNLLDHENEIYSRPKREWFISEAEKQEIVQNCKKIKYQ